MPSGTSEGVLGTGTILTLATSNWSAELTSIGQSGRSRPAIKTSHLGSVSTTGSGVDSFVPGGLVDEGSINVGFNFRPGVEAARPPMGAREEVVEIEFDSTEVNGAKASFSGFFTEDDWEGPLENNMTGSGTIKIAGAVSYTAAASV